MPAPRAILHVDMDAFFASVEQRGDPSLRGKPVLVGHDGPRGVVAAASYEARRFGCHSAQPISVAKRLCPDAIIVSGSHRRYAEVSRQVFAILHDVTPLVQPLSIDEAFLDVTGSVRLLGEPVEIAQRIRARIRDETGLTASIGLAPNKFLAKLVSDWSKPDGLTVIEPHEVLDRLAPLPIKAMWGVGPAMEKKLHDLSIRTFGDLQAMSLETARQRLAGLGDHGAEHYWHLARGEDARPVTPDSAARSISSERTFGADVGDGEAVRQVLLEQAEHVAWRVRRSALLGRTVHVKIRFGSFQTITRSATLLQPTDATAMLWCAASALFDRWRAESFQPVRLIGVGVSNLHGSDGRQLALFAEPVEERASRLDAATDAVVARFGDRSIHRGLRPKKAAAGEHGHTP